MIEPITLKAVPITTSILNKNNTMAAIISDINGSLELKLNMMIR